PQPDLPEDFTIFRSSDDDWKQRFDDNTSAVPAASSHGNSSKVRVIPVYSGRASFLFTRGDETVLYFARALACWCWAKGAVSITLRLEKETKFLVVKPDTAQGPARGKMWDTKTEAWSSEDSHVPNGAMYLGTITKGEFSSQAALQRKTGKEDAKGAGK